MLFDLLDPTLQGAHNRVQSSGMLVSCYAPVVVDLFSIWNFHSQMYWCWQTNWSARLWGSLACGWQAMLLTALGNMLAVKGRSFLLRTSSLLMSWCALRQISARYVCSFSFLHFHTYAPLPWFHMACWTDGNHKLKCNITVQHACLSCTDLSFRGVLLSFHIAFCD